MGKTFKKKELVKNTKFKNNSLEEEQLTELLDSDGSMISKNDNFIATDRDVKSKFTSSDKARRSSQGPASYYPWGGAYYGGYYTMNEENEIDTDLKKEIDEIAESKMQSLVDEMLTKKKSFDFVRKRTDEADLMHDVSIPEFSELKSKYEKPIIARKVMHLTDLMNKQNVSGEEMAIILNYIISNIDVFKLNEEHRQLLSDKLINGEQGEQ